MSRAKRISQSTYGAPGGSQHNPRGFRAYARRLACAATVFFERNRGPKLLLCGLCAAAIVFAARSRVLTAQAYCFDDYEYLVFNPLVRYPSPEAARKIFSEVLNPSTVHGYYQPLTMLSLMIDTWLGGAPGHLLVYHLTSLILHSLNTFLVLIVLYRLFRYLPAAGLGALLFGLNPVTLEPIPWIADRKTLLSTFFALTSIWAYIGYTQARRPISKKRIQALRGRGRPHQPFKVFVWYATCLISFAFSLLSKPTSTMLPVCLLVLDWWPLQRFAARSRQSGSATPALTPSPSQTHFPTHRSEDFYRVLYRVIEKIPLFLIAGISAWITYESQKRTAVVVNPSEYSDVLRIPMILLHNTIFYLQKILLPIGLTPDYGFPSGWSHPHVIAGLIGTPILLAALVFTLRWTRGWVAGWLFFMIMIFPTLGLVGFTDVIASDKYAYLPLLGLLLPVTSALAKVLTNPSRGVRQTWATGLALIFVGYIVMGWIYLGHWKTTESLHRYMFSMVPSAKVRIGLGVNLIDQGRVVEAIEQYEAVRQEVPHFKGVHFNLGAARLALGDVDDAIKMFIEELRRNPNDAATHNSLGSALLQKGRRGEAIQHYEKAIEQNRYYADAKYNLANVLAQQSDTAKAMLLYEEAIKIEPNHCAAHLKLANLLVVNGDLAQATGHYEQALKIRPDHIDIVLRLSRLYAVSSDLALRRPGRAIELAEYAVAQTKRHDFKCLATLAVAYAAEPTKKSQERALEIAREALLVAPKTNQAPQIEELRNDLKAFGVVLPS